MSPLGLRRYRAERVLREDFERLRGRVLANVGARLRARGVALDSSDVEECYAQAWQGLYGILLDGAEIANPAGWLVVATFRRAIEEQRARTRSWGGQVPAAVAHGDSASGADRSERARELADTRCADLAADLDDRQRLRALMEAMRCRLSEREREAASLCYLQGLSRRQAAAQMGLSESRMRKLMDGVSPRRPGVSGKLGALVADVRDGRWCTEQGSLMRALAFGILDPDGERYRVAAIHRRECPACRAYVASLRGIAAALPPVLAPLRLGPAALSHAAGAGAGTGAGAAGGHASGSAAGVGASSAPGIGAGVLGGAGAAKLAVGCLVVIGVGAGCVALGGAPGTTHRALGHGPHAGGRRAGSAAPRQAPIPHALGTTTVAGASRVAAARRNPGVPGSSPAGGGASREFTPEQPATAAALQPAPPRAALASSRAWSASSAAGEAGGGAARAAEREFSP
jgi:DNA-directed RNA polymerase specialized sigma24 family protein